MFSRISGSLVERGTTTLASAIDARLEEACADDATTYFRIKLAGVAQPDLDLDATALEARVCARFPGATVIDGSAALDYDAIAGEGRTVRAEFVRAMRKRISAAGDAERPTLEAALRYGVLAFTGRAIPR